MASGGNAPGVMRRFIELFLEGESLQRVMKHLCDTSVGQVVDPITDVVSVMITSPLQLVITEVGVAPFRDRAAHVYPFVEMDEAQRSFLHDIVLSHASCADGGIRGGGVAGETSIGAATMQMGGGCVIEFQPKRGPRFAPHSPEIGGDGSPIHKARRISSYAPPSPTAPTGSGGALYLNAEAVLLAMCKAVFASEQHTDSWRRHSVCSILLQRIAGGVHMPRETLQRVGDEIARIELSQSMQVDDDDDA